MKPYVDIEGSGQDRTTIKWTGGSQGPGSGTGSATLIGASNSELRLLTVKSDGTGQSYATAIHSSSASPRLTNVTASALGGAETFGVYNSSSSPTMRNVTATGSGGSNANYGMYQNNGSPTIAHSKLEGATYSVYRGGLGAVKIANSQLDGPLSASLICFNNYDMSFAAVLTCP